VNIVLVTGANGFVGSHICEALAATGFSVRALVRKTSDLTNLKGIDVNLFYGELSDPDSLAAAISGVDIVINNAGITKTIHPDDFQRINCGGTENMLRAVKGHNSDLGRFIHISSTAAVGPAPSLAPIGEDYPPNPLTVYGRSKLNAERAVLSNKDVFPVIILRPCAVYGPRDKEMFSLFKSVKMRIRPAFGNGKNYINFTYVKDLAQAVVKSIKCSLPSGTIFFVAEKKWYSYTEAGTIISEALGKKAIDLHIPSPIVSAAGWVSERIAQWRQKAVVFTEDKAREMLQRYWLFDISKIERDIGFISTEFRVGVRETIAWYKENGWL
jgi:nucleoside-diphosphate-sugar epimerase